MFLFVMYTGFLIVNLEIFTLLFSGFVCMTKPEYLLRNDCKSLYQQILSDQYQSARGKCMLLKSLQNHLMEEEARMTQSEGNIIRFYFLL